MNIEYNCTRMSMASLSLSCSCWIKSHLSLTRKQGCAFHSPPPRSEMLILDSWELRFLDFVWVWVNVSLLRTSDHPWSSCPWPWRPPPPHWWACTWSQTLAGCRISTSGSPGSRSARRSSKPRMKSQIQIPLRLSRAKCSPVSCQDRSIIKVVSSVINSSRALGIILDRCRIRGKLFTQN